jgi:hypothetical protein
MLPSGAPARGFAALLNHSSKGKSRTPDLFVSELRLPAVGSLGNHIEEMPDRTEVIARPEASVRDPQDLVRTSRIEKSGKIWIALDVGRGATFKVMLPRE